MTPATDSSEGPARATRPKIVQVLPRARQRPLVAHDWITERLSERDLAIVDAINTLRVLSGRQIQSLFFATLPSGRSQVVSRARVLQRLVALKVLAPLERRIGGAGRGSSGSVYALDSGGQRILVQRQGAAGVPVRIRRPGTPTGRTLNHMLAVSQLFVDLIELGREHDVLIEYQTEPACWWPNGLGGKVKPDAYARLTKGPTVDHWWVEEDQATESLPTLLRKLEVYLDFLRRGQLGPDGVVPRVLVATVTDRRSEVVRHAISRLRSPAGDLVSVATNGFAARHLFEVLRE